MNTKEKRFRDDSTGASRFKVYESDSVQSFKHLCVFFCATFMRIIIEVIYIFRDVVNQHDADKAEKKTTTCNLIQFQRALCQTNYIFSCPRLLN
jgi:hypothetical protein